MNSQTNATAAKQALHEKVKNTYNVGLFSYYDASGTFYAGFFRNNGGSTVTSINNLN